MILSVANHLWTEGRFAALTMKTVTMNAKTLFISALAVPFLLTEGNAPFTSPGQRDRDQARAYLTIPFRFLPDYRITGDSVLVCREGEGILEVPAGEVAIVLIDTWNNQDADERQQIGDYLKNLREFLNQCRGNGLTVIHAPNHPVTDKYTQYRQIKEEVEQHTAPYSLDEPVIPFLDWPEKNAYQEKINAYRSAGKEPLYRRNPKNVRDISRYLVPLENEYVVSSYHEFRYVLWKEKVKVILYAGGSLNECMLHRDTGINLLAGTDSGRTNFAIVVLEECIYTIESPRTDYATARQAMLDYYKQKIAVVSASDRLVFHVDSAQISKP